jgi:hypothetical protein
MSILGMLMLFFGGCENGRLAGRARSSLERVQESFHVCSTLDVRSVL